MNLRKTNDMNTTLFTLTGTNYSKRTLVVIAAVLLGSHLLAQTRSGAAQKQSAANVAPTWTKEPNSFRGARFGSSEATVRSKFNVEECTADDAKEPNTCSFQFDISDTTAIGLLTFQNDSLVEVSGVFDPDSFATFRDVFVEQYGKPLSQVKQDMKWPGKVVSVLLYQTLPTDHRSIVTKISLVRYKAQLNKALKLYQIQTDTAVKIFKINHDRMAYDAKTQDSDRQYEQRRRDAETENEKFNAVRYGGFTMTLNDYQKKKTNIL
jgi:hypothetical protein